MKFPTNKKYAYVSGVKDINSSSNNDGLVSSGWNTGGGNNFGILADIVQIDVHVVGIMIHGSMLVRVKVGLVEAKTEYDVIIKSQEWPGSSGNHVLLISNYTIYLFITIFIIWALFRKYYFTIKIKITRVSWQYYFLIISLIAQEHIKQSFLGERFVPDNVIEKDVHLFLV